MAPPTLRCLRFLLLMLFVSRAAATFPLEIPKRPTSFPLQRPTLAGEVIAWGSNTFGQITVPPNATNVVVIAAGLNHNLALRADGTVVAWGDNRLGQCDVPAGLSDVVAISGGVGQSLALKSNGRVVAWGAGGQPPSTLTDAISVTVGWQDSFAVRIDGTPVRWGASTDSFPYNLWTNLVTIAAASQFPSA